MQWPTRVHGFAHRCCNYLLKSHQARYCLPASSPLLSTSSMTCSSFIVRPSCQAAAKASSPNWARAAATVCSYPGRSTGCKGETIASRRASAAPQSCAAQLNSPCAIPHWCLERVKPYPSEALHAYARLLGQRNLTTILGLFQQADYLIRTWRILQSRRSYGKFTTESSWRRGILTHRRRFTVSPRQRAFSCPECQPKKEESHVSRGK